MESRQKLIVTYIALVIVGSAAMSELAVIREMRAELRKYEEEDLKWKIDCVLNALRIPSEALYNDFKDSKKLAQMREEMYNRQGIKSFWPYPNVVQDAYSMDRYVQRQPYDYAGTTCGFQGSTEFPTDWHTIVHFQSENWWVSHTHSSLLFFEGELRDNVRMGAYFNSHPEQFDKLLKPRLMRITGASTYDLSLIACRILLSKGYKSQEIKDAIAKLIAAPKVHRVVGKGIGRKEYEDFDSSSKSAMRLNMEYGLGLEGPDGLAGAVK